MKYLTLKQVQQQLSEKGVDVVINTIRMWIKTGRLKGGKIGGQFRAEQEVLNDYMKYLTLKQVQQQLSEKGVDVVINTIRMWIKTGRLKGGKIGGQFRVEQEVLNDYIN